MPLPAFDVCYRALIARDGRFDGLFFVGVKSTRIYCRPVCTARPPRAVSCTFFPAAASAEQAGFRPCLRCRPELAPGDSSLERALYAHVQARSLYGEPLETVAAGAGYSPRQLRRVLLQHYGVTPVEIGQTQRLLFAKKLLQETTLPVIDVAASAGFGSLRRFNALFASRYRLSPTGLRRQSRESAVGHGNTLSLRLAFRPPLAWDCLLNYLARRATPGVEAVSDGAYCRSVITANGTVGWVRVTRPKTGDYLRVEAPAHLASALPDILPRVRNLFDLDANPTVIDSHLAGDPRLAPLIQAHPGLRTPGAWDPFELALRAILGQQVSVAGATTLAGRLAKRFGRPVETPFAGVTHLAVAPADLTAANLVDIAGIGIPASRARTIQATSPGVLDLPRRSNAADAVAALRQIPGIGEWTAQYVAMRALRFPDAFPDADLGLRKALTDSQHAPYIPARAVLRLAESWRPWRAYAAIHLWQSLTP